MTTDTVFFLCRFDLTWNSAPNHLNLRIGLIQKLRVQGRCSSTSTGFAKFLLRAGLDTSSWEIIGFIEGLRFQYGCTDFNQFFVDFQWSRRTSHCGVIRNMKLQVLKRLWVAYNWSRLDSLLGLWFELWRYSMCIPPLLCIYVGMELAQQMLREAMRPACHCPWFQ